MNYGKYEISHLGEINVNYNRTRSERNNMFVCKWVFIDKQEGKLFPNSDFSASASRFCWRERTFSCKSTNHTSARFALCVWYSSLWKCILQLCQTRVAGIRWNKNKKNYEGHFTFFNMLFFQVRVYLFRKAEDTNRRLMWLGSGLALLCLPLHIFWVTEESSDQGQSYGVWCTLLCSGLGHAVRGLEDREYSGLKYTADPGCLMSLCLSATSVDSKADAHHLF